MPVVDHPHCVDVEIERGHRRIEIDIDAVRGVTSAEPCARPVADEAARLVAGDPELAAGQVTAPVGEPGCEAIHQWQHAAYRPWVRAPVRRIAGDDPQPLR
ncbi:hypothetical protein [Lysobacter sp. CFH 32150]|uniref:hypothetical protein n=1 Tax=Lysobacter sp. CFH 32150 TaxID=2927128 RepID=UPI001FA787E7|nr:hypothetical protein [Lysobacter sp. CFH 32150]MCI4567310.1 hypothetical protein [Lysobacter sp. CFH 32150]